MARSPVTEVLERYHALSEEQQKVFLDIVDPQVEPEPAKQTRKKRGQRSARASGMAAAIKNSLEQGKEAADNAAHSSGQLCKAMVPGLGVECGDPEDNRVHDKSAGYAGYHPFEAATPAPVATRRSSRKAAVASSTPNSETNSEGALAVGAGGN